MNLSPILRAKLANYADKYELESLKQDEQFERFVNYHIISQQHPNAFSTNSEDLEKISIGGSNDLGFDGIAISLNNNLIYSIQDIDDILACQNKAQFHITFIQSKNKSGFNLGEFTTFAAGILDFLQEKVEAPANKGIQYWHEIYTYIVSGKIVRKWISNPSIECDYVTTGKWDENAHIKAHEKNIKRQINEKHSWEDIAFHYIDGNKMLDIINGNENLYTTTLDVVDTMSLPEVKNVDDSTVAVCEATEIFKLINNEGYLRRNLFEDNVRDYQGDTVVNREMIKTLRENKQDFMLLNNGITIVCEELNLTNRKITLKNPQIVNGCQTCNVIYTCAKKNISLEDAHLIVKVISSHDTEIVNSIVKGSNRQNIVYDEAFEVTKNFHKLLEEYFANMQIGKYRKIYYERRSKQYEGDINIKPSQKVNFRTLIQGIVSLFFCKPEDGYHHESKLLKEYKAKIFLEDHPLEPYYLSSFLCVVFDNLRRRRAISKQHNTYKYHILLILKEMLGGPSESINKTKATEKYCKKIMDQLQSCDLACLANYIEKACAKFDEIVESWIAEKGENARYHVKDSSDFTTYMLSCLRDNVCVQSDGESDIAVHRGRIMHICNDKKVYGFIEYEPENIYFDKIGNPEFDFMYKDKDVFFEIKEQNGKKYGVRVRYCD